MYKYCRFCGKELINRLTMKCVYCGRDLSYSEKNSDEDSKLNISEKAIIKSVTTKQGIEIGDSNQSYEEKEYNEINKTAYDEGKSGDDAVISATRCSNNLAEELREYKKLLNQGLITEDDYNKLKKRVLGI